MQCDEINNILYIKFDQDIVNDNNMYLIHNESHIINIKIGNGTINGTACSSQSSTLSISTTNIPQSMEIMDIYYNDNKEIQSISSKISINYYYPNISIQSVLSRSGII